ncbi:MAG: ATP-dependent helicase [Bacteriovoracaceae bacterium]|nr:ATP-dependent helicase [Bacteriovoracaceae bacterium]
MTSRINKPDTATDVYLKIFLDEMKSFTMIAGAGSGKTTSLVKSLTHIKTTKGALLQKRGQRVACITYTTIAEQEIWHDVGHDPLFHVSTIHSFLWSLVKSFQTDIKIWVKLRIEEKLTKLRTDAANFGPRVQAKTRSKNSEDIERYTSELAFIDAVSHFNYETGSKYSKGILGHDDIVKMVPTIISNNSTFKKIIAQKYPYIFIDESQDTLEEVVSAFKSVQAQEGEKFCLGFYGDPMQKIYATGIGSITIPEDWKTLQKPENFRCPKNVLTVINNIRKQGDRLEQTGRENHPNGLGSSYFFIFPQDDQRDENILKARNFIARKNSDPLWTTNTKETDLRILVIVHRMAANRLGFSELYSAFIDHAPESLKLSFNDGTAWPLRPFVNVILPLINLFKSNTHCEILKLLRVHSPLLKKENLDASTADINTRLSNLQESLRNMTTMFNDGSTSTMKEVLSFATTAQLLTLDDTYLEYLNGVVVQDPNNEDDLVEFFNLFFKCPATQLYGHQKYFSDESPYSTQQGIKGAEFQRVIVILDDEEGRHIQFSYEKLLGLKAASTTDQQNIRDNKDSVFDRTRRLFYVCCSRAVRDLAVVLFTNSVPEATSAIKALRIIDDASVITLDNLQ